MPRPQSTKAMRERDTHSGHRRWVSHSVSGGCPIALPIALDSEHFGILTINSEG